MQQVLAKTAGGIVGRSLPPPRCRVPGYALRWARTEEIGTAAYWAAQSFVWENEEPRHYRLGRTLADETLACLLGGYGIPAEIGLAAYVRLRRCHPDMLVDAGAVLDLLVQPFEVGGRLVRYRFARTKAAQVAASMAALGAVDAGAKDRPLRDALTALPGIGMKTASWIVRNWRDSDHVSILDVHIVRACRALGVFDPSMRVERHYRAMECAYLAFARAIGARAAILDSVMWMTMRQLPASIVAGLQGDAGRPAATRPRHEARQAVPL